MFLIGEPDDQVFAPDVRFGCAEPTIWRENVITRGGHHVPRGSDGLRAGAGDRDLIQVSVWSIRDQIDTAMGRQTGRSRAGTG